MPWKLINCMNLCTFYLGAEVSLESCGPRRGIDDIPHVVMVRYMRNDSMNDAKDTKTSNSIMDSLKDDVDPASQLVAWYNGSTETSLIIEWVSKIIRDGDSANLPFYRTKTPELVNENPDPLWFVSTEKLISTSGGLKHKLKSILAGCRDLRGDPRLSPLLLLGALMSFGWICLRRCQPASANNSNQPQQADSKDDVPQEWRNRRRISPTGEVPPPVTDTQPKDAYQMPLSDSESE